jgi:hypothetical protein
VAGHSSPSQSQQTPGPSRPRVPARTPSLRMAIIIFVGLLILFRWLHLILALQLASTGRQIQIKTEDLQRIERQNTSLVQQISEAESPSVLADRATQEGYKPDSPVYLQTNQPLAPPAASIESPWAGGQNIASSGAGAKPLTPWEALSQQTNARAQAQTTP